jgi:8-oxo-dGTP diphosphatase
MDFDPDVRLQATSEHESPINAAGGVVYRWTSAGQLEVLLIKKQGGFWTLPKGRIKAGEERRDAVAREVAEETGLTGQVEDLVCEVVYTIQKSGRHRPKMVAYYLLQADEGVPRPQAKERITRVRWYPIETALKRIGRGRIRAVVRDARTMLMGEEGNADEV